MGRTRAELAARLREGYEANNWAPALDVLAELEAPEAAPAVIADAGGSDLSGGGAAADEAESCGDPAPAALTSGKAITAAEIESCGDPVLGEAIAEGESDAWEAPPEDDADRAGGGEDAPFGLPDRAGEDGEERPGLHHRAPRSKRPVRRKR